MPKYFLMKLKGLFPCFKLSYKEELFKKSEKIYEREVDYIDVLKKLQDIDKLKQVLLNHNQLILFNFLSKPMIHINNKQMKQLKIDYSINLDLSERERKKDLKETLDFYEKIKNEGGLTEVDERLFGVLHESIKKSI